MFERLNREVFNPTQDRTQANFEALSYAYGSNWYDSTDQYERY